MPSLPRQSYRVYFVRGDRWILLRQGLEEAEAREVAKRQWEYHGQRETIGIVRVTIEVMETLQGSLGPEVVMNAEVIE